MYEKCQSELIRLQEEFKYGRLCIEEVETQLDVLKRQDLNKAQEDHKLDLEHLRAEWLKTQAESVLRDDTLTETPKRNSFRKGICMLPIPISLPILLQFYHRRSFIFLTICFII